MGLRIAERADHEQVALLVELVQALTRLDDDLFDRCAADVMVAGPPVGHVGGEQVERVRRIDADDDLLADGTRGVDQVSFVAKGVSAS
jgi:hypothetical protein